MEEWISVTNQLPGEGVSVLCVNVNMKKPIVYEGFRNGNAYTSWALGSEYRLQITHWMPLPKPPSE